jgi:fatty acid desaturase
MSSARVFGYAGSMLRALIQAIVTVVVCVGYVALGSIYQRYIDPTLFFVGVYFIVPLALGVAFELWPTRAERRWHRRLRALEKIRARPRVPRPPGWKRS